VTTEGFRSASGTVGIWAGPAALAGYQPSGEPSGILRPGAIDPWSLEAPAETCGHRSAIETRAAIARRPRWPADPSGGGSPSGRPLDCATGLKRQSKRECRIGDIAAVEVGAMHCGTLVFRSAATRTGGIGLGAAHVDPRRPRTPAPRSAARRRRLPLRLPAAR
jgi:hypothetical protein